MSNPSSLLSLRQSQLPSLWPFQVMKAAATTTTSGRPVACRFIAPLQSLAAQLLVADQTAPASVRPAPLFTTPGVSARLPPARLMETSLSIRWKWKATISSKTNISSPSRHAPVLRFFPLARDSFGFGRAGERLVVRHTNPQDRWTQTHTYTLERFRFAKKDVAST